MLKHVHGLIFCIFFVFPYFCGGLFYNPDFIKVSGNTMPLFGTPLCFARFNIHMGRKPLIFLTPRKKETPFNHFNNIFLTKNCFFVRKKYISFERPVGCKLFPPLRQTFTRLWELWLVL